jgi:hypothetical protein
VEAPAAELPFEFDDPTDDDAQPVEKHVKPTTSIARHKAINTFDILFMSIKNSSPFFKTPPYSKLSFISAIFVNRNMPKT